MAKQLYSGDVIKAIYGKGYVLADSPEEALELMKEGSFDATLEDAWYSVSDDFELVQNFVLDIVDVKELDNETIDRLTDILDEEDLGLGEPNPWDE